METVSSDTECVARSLSEPEAFEPLFDRHFGAVHTYLHRRAGRELADELAAETFVVASSGARLAVQAAASCRGCTGSRRTCSTAAGGPSAVNCAPTVAAASTGGSPTKTKRQHDSTVPSLDAQLARALAAMRPRQRDALLLYALADLSYEEIALALDVPVGTVRTWLHRARQIADANSRRSWTSLARQQELN